MSIAAEVAAAGVPVKGLGGGFTPAACTCCGSTGIWGSPLSKATEQLPEGLQHSSITNAASDMLPLCVERECRVARFTAFSPSLLALTSSILHLIGSPPDHSFVSCDVGSG
jgi:hypothetical protein